MRTIAADLGCEHVENAGIGSALVPVREDVYGDARQQLMLAAGMARRFR